MDWLRQLARRLGMLVHGRQFDAELEEEMRLHVELRQQEQIETGMSADDARAAAQRRFGNPTVLREKSHMAWGWEWLENFIKDAIYGVPPKPPSPRHYLRPLASAALRLRRHPHVLYLPVLVDRRL